MKKSIIAWGCLIIFGLILGEAHSILYQLNPELANTQLNLFIIKHRFPISLAWYIKNTCDSLLLILVFFVAAKISYQYSFKLFLIFCVCFVYGMGDLFLFWLNYKSEPYSFWLLVASVCTAISFLIFAKEKRQSIYKSLT